MITFPANRRRSLVVLAIYSFMVFALTAITGHGAEAALYQLNDRVETNISVFGWQKGTITEIGKDSREGHVKVHGDGFPNNYPGWVQLPPNGKFIRRIEGVAPAPVEISPPRLGKYDIRSFGPGGKFLYLGHRELQAGGTYRVSRKSAGDYFGEGTYLFDAVTKSIKWLSGPYQEKADWSGGFEVDRGGKTHRITLRRGTIATNNTD